MKKILIVSLLVFFIAGSAYAQNETKFRFGLKGSPALCWLKPDKKNLKNDGMKLGFGYGLQGEITLGTNFSLATGFDIYYSGGNLQKTYNDTNLSTLGIVQTGKYNLQHLEIPFTLKMETNEIGYITYYGQIGLGLGMRLKAKGTFDTKDSNGNPIAIPEPEDDDISDDINFFRGSFLIGGGIEYSLGGNTSALLGVTFNNGLINIFDKEDKAINNYVALHLGVLF